MAKGDNRAVVGASGKPLPGMVLESGAKTIRNKLGQYARSSVGQTNLRTSGAHFDVDGMRDVSIGAVKDPSDA
jgi:hypothetical protein